MCVCVCVYVCVWRTDRKPRPGPAQLSRALARPARASGLERAARSPGPERAASPPGWSAGASLSATWAPAPASPRLVRLRNRPKVSTLDTVTATVVRHSQIIRFARPAAPLYLKGVRRIRANSGLSDPTLSVWKPNIITIYQSGNPTLSVWKPNIISLETQHYRSGNPTLSVWIISLETLGSNPYPLASFTHLSYTRDMTWICYLERAMTSYTTDMTWISQMQII